MRHALTIAALVAMCGPALGHGWYSGTTSREGLNCCNTVDCQPIAPHTVEEVRGGFQVTLKPGEHLMVSRPVSHFVPYRDMQHSPDGKWHVCLFPNQDTVRCFFGPVGGS